MPGRRRHERDVPAGADSRRGRAAGRGSLGGGAVRRPLGRPEGARSPDRADEDRDAAAGGRENPSIALKQLGSRGDVAPRAFSFRSRLERFPGLRQVDCFLTHTTERTHDLIRRNLDRSPLYSGVIRGRGPRYCPSIEDKVVRFAERDRHQIFVEPEGLDTDWTYLSGLSMSLPADVQEEVVRSLPGLEQAEILRPAYAIEYDVVFPEQLDDTLAVRELPGLFLAGQVNGTSGYEEAAGQGLVAGVNAALVAKGRERAPFTLGRHEAYIGVMIDDLVTLGAEEPYRLLTSRAEHRLLLGGDTAYARLAEKGLALRASRRGGGRPGPGTGGAAAGGACGARGVARTAGPWDAPGAGGAGCRTVGRDDRSGPSPAARCSRFAPGLARGAHSGAAGRSGRRGVGTARERDPLRGFSEERA